MNTKKQEKAETLFSRSDKTFQQFVDERWNLERLGPYDYIAFCKMMKTHEFLELVKKDYQNKMKEESIENENK